MYNPCRFCGRIPDPSPIGLVSITCCNHTSPKDRWNGHNPIDELEQMKERLAECYATLALLCHANIGHDEVTTIRALFDRHQTKYNAS